jgi:hypothetical protein
MWPVVGNSTVNTFPWERKHTTIEEFLEAVSSMRLYNEDQLDRRGNQQPVVSQRSESAVGSLDSHC